MQTYEQAVILSCAWGGQRDEIIHKIDKALQTRENELLRHRRELICKGAISRLMARIG
jgi:hypothetical protein